MWTAQDCMREAAANYKTVSLWMPKSYGCLRGALAAINALRCQLYAAAFETPVVCGGLRVTSLRFAAVYTCVPESPNRTSLLRYMQSRAAASAIYKALACGLPQLSKLPCCVTSCASLHCGSPQ